MTRLACIIPTHNMAATLGVAIKSAVAAGMDDIVVVDDCSTDDTAAVLEQWSSVVTVWRWPRKPREWIAAQRVVWETTEADHYVWLAADDALYPELGAAIRAHADADVVFTDYDVVSPAGAMLWTVSQDVATPTRLSADEMRARIQTDRNATETGSGSSLSRRAAMWLWHHDFYVMGPHADSIGYATAACMFGCALVPVRGALFTRQEQSYSQGHVPDATVIERGYTCRNWMRHVGLDDATTRALALKRCRVKW